MQWPALVCANDLLRTCSIRTQGNRAPLTVSPPSINSPINGGLGHLVHGISWDEMFAACKYNTVKGLPNDDFQTSWMSEQRRRKAKLDSVGFVWNDSGISEQAEGNEKTNRVSRMDGIWLQCSRHCFCDAFNALYLVCADYLLRTFVVIVQGDLDRASLAIESPSMNLPVNRGVEHQVRGLLIPFAVLAL
jgi:hypothetical protein